MSSVCAYCGGECPNDSEGKYLCDGFMGDVDNLYGGEDE